MMDWNDYGFGWNAGLGMFMMVIIWGGLIALGVCDSRPYHSRPGKAAH